MDLDYVHEERRRAFRAGYLIGSVIGFGMALLIVQLIWRL